MQSGERPYFSVIDFSTISRSIVKHEIVTDKERAQILVLKKIKNSSQRDISFCAYILYILIHNDNVLFLNTKINEQTHTSLISDFINHHTEDSYQRESKIFHVTVCDELFLNDRHLLLLLNFMTLIVPFCYEWIVDCSARCTFLQ